MCVCVVFWLHLGLTCSISCLHVKGLAYWIHFPDCNVTPWLHKLIPHVLEHCVPDIACMSGTHRSSTRGVDLHSQGVMLQSGKYIQCASRQVTPSLKRTVMMQTQLWNTISSRFLKAQLINYAIKTRYTHMYSISLWSTFIHIHVFLSHMIYM